MRRWAERKKNMHPLFGIVRDVLAQFLFFHSSIVVRRSSRSFCIIFIFLSIVDCILHTSGCRFLFAFLCCNRAVFVFTVSHDLHSQWIDVLCSFANEKGCIEPDYYFIYLLIDSRHVFPIEQHRSVGFSLANVSNNRYHLWRKSHSSLTHREWMEQTF